VSAFLSLNREWFSRRYVGIALSILLGIAAITISQRYSAPVMLFAILIGLALHPTYDSNALKPGINWCARPLLQIGVALLGFRVDVTDIQAIGWIVPLMTISCLVLTISIGTLFARWLGIATCFSILISGAVAICGVSAVAAISAVLPKDQSSDREFALTVAGVTGMSTLVMILYPLVSQWLNHTDLESGVFLGASIHDVAQVIGAGYSVSEIAGDTAALVKLLRVSALLPVIIILGMIYGRRGTQQDINKRQLLPLFILVYIFIAAINSLHLWPEAIKITGIECSKFFLVTSIIAIGLKTNLKDISTVGKTPVFALVSVTFFMAVLVLMSIEILSL